MPAAEPPRLTMPTARGWLLLGGGVVMVVGGLLRVDGALAALGGGGLLLLLLCWLAGRMNLGRLVVEIEAPARVFAGAAFPLRMTLRNQRGWFDAYGVDFELVLPGNGRSSGRAGWTPAGSASDLAVRLAIPARGRVSGLHYVLSSAFPLGVFRFRSGGLAAVGMRVFPRPLTPIELLAAGVLMDAAPLEGASAGDAPGEPRGLRGYRSGDRSSRIHWAASLRARARGAGPVVRENDPPGFHPREAQVVFHSFASDGELIRPDRFERALSLAAGTLRHLHALGIPARFTADFLHWKDVPAASRGQLADCLELLAEARRAPGTEAHELEALLARVPPACTLVILSDMPAESWQRLVPARPLAPLVIDIRRHAGRGRRRLILTPKPAVAA